MFLLSIYWLYLFSALTMPYLSKLAAGFLLLLGLIGLYRLKGISHDLMSGEKWLLVSFVLFSLVSIFSFFYWPQSRDARMHLEDYATFMMLVPLYLLLRQFRFSFSWVLVLLVSSAIFLGLVSMVQLSYWGISRPSGGVNAMRYGAVSLVMAMFSLNAMLLIRQKSFWVKLVLGLAICMGLLACFLAQSRGSWLAMPVLALAYTVYLYRAGHPRYLIVLVFGSVVLLAVVSQSQVVEARVQQFVSNFESYQNGDSQNPIGGRFDMFKAAGVLIKQNPIWGHGLNSYSPKATEIRKATQGMSNEVGLWNNPHNEILQVMVEKGVIGLVTLLLLFAAPACFFLQALHWAGDSIDGRQVKFYAWCGLSLLIVYAVAGQSVALFEHDVFNHFFALMILLFASQVRVIGEKG